MVRCLATDLVGSARRGGTVLVLCAGLVAAAGPARSQGISDATIIDDWAKVQVPAAPALKPVTIRPAETALLVLDFNGAQDPTKGPCNSNKPRCIASLPRMQALLATARAHDVLVVYSLAGPNGPADIATAIAPRANDPVVKSGPDKFVNTDLGKILAEHKIATVIVTGTASEGAVLDTATDAALHGLNVIVPVDAMSSNELYAEQYVAWHLTHAPGVAAKTTLTRIGLIGF